MSTSYIVICLCYYYCNKNIRYFEEDDEDATPALAYIPAPGSPTRVEMEQKGHKQDHGNNDDDDDDDDPLDAYMAGIEKEVCCTIDFFTSFYVGFFFYY